MRVAKLVAIRLDDVDLDAARIRITHGKGGKDRVVPFPRTFRETLALHIADRRKAGGGLSSQRWRTTVVFTRPDIEMPGLDGIAAAAAVRDELAGCDPSS